MSKATMESTIGINVQKNIPLDFDLGHLMATDIQQPFENETDIDIKNLLSSSSNTLVSYTRDNVQLFFNTLFSLPIQKTHDEESMVFIQLSQSKLALPRMKPIPKAAPETPWQKFAKKKGITKTKERMKFNEEFQEYMPKYGPKSAKSHPLNGWIREVGPNDDLDAKSKHKK